MGTNPRKAINKFHQKRAAENKEKLKAQIRKNSSAPNPKSGLVRQAYLQKNINSVVRRFLLEYGFGELKILKVQEIAFELYKLQKQTEKINTYTRNLEKLSKIQINPKLQKRYSAAKREHHRLFFKYLDEKVPFRKAVERAGIESGLNEVEKKYQEELKKAFEDSDFTFRNAPPRMLSRSPIDLFRSSFDANKKNFREMSRLHSRIMMELGSIKLGAKLLYELLQIDGFTEW